MEVGALVAMGMFVAGLIYHAGRMSARLDGVEAAVTRVEATMHKELADIKAMLVSLVGRRRDDHEGEG